MKNLMRDKRVKEIQEDSIMKKNIKIRNIKLSHRKQMIKAKKMAMASSNRTHKNSIHTIKNIYMGIGEGLRRESS